MDHNLSEYKQQPPLKLSEQPDTDADHSNIFQHIATTIDSEANNSQNFYNDQSNLLDPLLSDSDVNDSQFEPSSGVQVNQSVDTSSDTEPSTCTEVNLGHFVHSDPSNPLDRSFSESRKESIQETSGEEKDNVRWRSSVQLPAMNEAGEQLQHNNSISSASTSNTTAAACSSKKPLGGFKWKRASVRAIELQEIGT